MNKTSLTGLIRRGMQGHTLNEFARLAGISAGNLSRILRGQRPSAAVLKKISAAAVGVSQEELLRAADYLEGESQTGIPIYGTVAAGLPINAYEDILGTVRIDYDLPGDPEDYFALRVRGTSMDAAHIPDGSLIIVKKTRQIEEGQIGVFLVGGEATVKVFARKEDHIILIPQSTDTEHLPQIYDATDEVSVLGRVVRSVVSMPCSV